MDEDDYGIEEIVLLSEFSDCLLGAVYDAEGAPVPAYSSEECIAKLMNQGMSEEQAVEWINFETEGMKLLWIHPLELDVELEPDPHPHLRLVH